MIFSSEMTPKSDTYQTLQIVSGIPVSARECPEAARTAGRCDLPGVACDTRLLSCFLFQPPLRSSGRRTRSARSGLAGVEGLPRGWAHCSTSRRFLLRCSCHFSGKIVSPDSGSQRLQHRVSPLQGARVPPSPEKGHKSPYRG